MTLLWTHACLGPWPSPSLWPWPWHLQSTKADSPNCTLHSRVFFDASLHTNSRQTIEFKNQTDSSWFRTQTGSRGYRSAGLTERLNRLGGIPRLADPATCASEGAAEYYRSQPYPRQVMSPNSSQTLPQDTYYTQAPNRKADANARTKESSVKSEDEESSTSVRIKKVPVKVGGYKLNCQRSVSARGSHDPGGNAPGQQQAAQAQLRQDGGKGLRMLAHPLASLDVLTQLEAPLSFCLTLIF